MTMLLEKAIELVRGLPAPRQDEIAEAMFSLAAGEFELEHVDPAHLPAVLEGLEQAERREFATDDEVGALFRRFGR
jgi:hypothetical protein